jgi:two-component system, sensor histidine kinase and response regulator
MREKWKNMQAENSKTPEILIVDDTPVNLKLLGDILEGEGYIVRPVPNGKLALNVAEKGKPDLILLDIMMPDMDGFEVCKKLKENLKLKDVPIIFISAYTETGYIVKALSLGGVDFITKPIQAEEVLVRVNTHLKLHQQVEELKELNESRNKLFSIITHDLRSPLSGFLGLTQHLVEELPNLNMATIHEMAVDMRNSATSFFGLLENLLQWSQMEQGKIPFNPQNTQLSKVVNESISTVRFSADLKGIEIINYVPEGLNVIADDKMIQTVIRNLVSNAVKFTQSGGKIDISARVSDLKSVELSISDSGIGMSSTMIDNLFRNNKQTNRPGTENESSTGLGLIICKNLIEMHGGQLLVESTEGKGSVFRFPLAKLVDNCS